jgi:hypothetical protein
MFHEEVDLRHVIRAMRVLASRDARYRRNLEIWESMDDECAIRWWVQVCEDADGPDPLELYTTLRLEALNQRMKK